MTNSTTFPGILTCPTSLVSNVMTMGTTKTFVVTMTNASGANKYYIDGYLQASLVLHQGQTYIFDLSSGTLDGHPFEFSTTNNGSHGGGSAYTTGITTTGTYASSQKRTFVVSASTPTTLYYYCTNHSGMGGSVSISSEAELIVSGGAEFIGTGTIKLPSGTTSERPTTGITGSIRYNTTTGFMETYTEAGWGSIATPPIISAISPVEVAGGSTATQVFTVTGTGFDADLTIKLVGANGTEYSVFNTTFVNTRSATFKMGANGATGGYDVAQKPFKVKLTGGSGLSSTSAGSISFLAPTISGVSPTTMNYTAVGSQTITVTGTNFTASMASGNKVQVLGANGSTLYNVNSAAVASATSITFKLAASGGSLSSGQLAQRPYKVRITNDIGITATSTATIGFNGIAWTSPASGATLTYTMTISSSQNLVAKDDTNGSDVTFSITSGSVSGLSIGSTGASPATYGGTVSAAGTTNVTFRATDNVTGATADRTFSIVGIANSLYSLASTQIFHVSSTGYQGGSIAQARAAMSPSAGTSAASWANNLAYLNVQGAGVVVWTVPETTSYQIIAGGARGGQSQSAGGGEGAYTRGTFSLTKGHKLRMIVGQQGQDGQVLGNTASGGGGGASVVTNENGNTLYVLGGGGGGSNSRAYNSSASGTSAGTSQSNSTSPGSYYSRYQPGGGGCWGSDGNGTSTSRGKNLLYGQGGTYSHPQNQREGGFGGGGAAGALQGGGGGGYGGGGCNDYDEAPGAFGGTSRSNGSNVAFGSTYQLGHGAHNGVVIVQKL